MKTEITVITPALAQRMLASNTSNRKLSNRRVEQLADQMTCGTWVFNGDAVRVSDTGRLLDGQHRLSAIIKSGLAQKCVLVTGLPDEVFTTIDVGAARSASDFLAIDGFKNTTNLAATAALFINYQLTGNPFYKSGIGKIPKKAIVEFCRNNDSAVAFSAKVDNRKKLKQLFSPSAMAFCLCVFSGINAEIAEKFTDELESGYYSYDDSPVAALRDRLMLTSSAGSTTKKLGAAMIFKAFQMYALKQKCKHIRLTVDESKWFTI